MTLVEESKTVKRRRPRILIWCIPLFFGLFGFFRVAESQQFESYRTLHVVQLLLTGACFGATLVGLIMWLVLPRD